MSDQREAVTGTVERAVEQAELGEQGEPLGRLRPEEEKELVEGAILAPGSTEFPPCRCPKHRQSEGK